MAAIFIGLGANGERQWLELATANRHGLVAGATGTGKTVTLQGLAEDFSAAGVPVFLAEQVPEHRRVVGVGVVAHAKLGRARLELVGVLRRRRAGHRDAREVAFHVGEKHRHTCGGEVLGQALQGHRLAGAGRAGDQPVAVGRCELELLPLAVRAEPDEDCRHRCAPSAAARVWRAVWR